MLDWLPPALARALAEQAHALGASCACHCNGHHDDSEGEDAIQFVEGLEELTHIDAAMDAEAHRWTLPLGCRLTVLLMGPLGSGKTTLFNLLSSKDAFGADGRSQHQTQLSGVQRWQSSDGGLCLIDAAGFENGLPPSEEVSQFLANVCLVAPHGVSMLFYVVKFGTISEECLSLLIFLAKYVFDSTCLLNLYVVVTHAPQELLLHPRSASAWVQSQADKDPGFRYVYTLAGRNPSRFILVDTPTQPPSRRLREIEERRRATARTFYNAFCDHPTSIVADFTTPLMREVQDAAKAQGQALLEAQMEVARLRGELRRRPYGRKLLELNEDSPTAAYYAQLWNVSNAATPTPVLPGTVALSQDGDGNLKEEKDLPARVEKAEAVVRAAHVVLEKRLMEVQRAPFYHQQVAVLVQRGHTRFLEDLRMASTPRNAGRAKISRGPSSQTLLSSLKPFEEVPPKLKTNESELGFSVFADIVGNMAAANVEERLPCLIFDWDDTLCPTWWMRSMLPPAGQEASVTHALKLALHAGRVEQVLRAARSFGYVDIVTLANRQWLEQTSKFLSPGHVDLLSLFEELQIQVHHAQSKASPKAGVFSPAAAVQAKKDAMAHVLEKYYGDSIKAQVHVLSFGDQDAEATAIQELTKDAWATSWQRPICKVIRLPQDPDLQDLGKSLQKILAFLPALVRAETDLDLPVNKLDTMSW